MFICITTVIDIIGAAVVVVAFVFVAVVGVITIGVR
jgi:hypothetical protein